MQNNSQKLIAVTGANGFIGLHIVQRLLNENFKVLATVRDVNNESKLKDLKKLQNSKNLSFASANLTQKEGFLKAFQNVNAIVHNASPLGQNGQKYDEDYFVKPALEGAQNVMDAILEQENSKLENLVFISSTSAVRIRGDDIPEDYIFSEKDWSDEAFMRDKKNYYALSKTLAEKKVMSYEDQLKEKGIKLTSICPTYVLGPLLQSDSINKSTGKLAEYLTGEKQDVGNVRMNLVDVRDVAEMVCQAIVQNTSGRFLAVENGYKMQEIVDMIRKHGGPLADKVTKNTYKGVEEPFYSHNVEKSVKLMKKDFIKGEDIIKATIDSFFEKNLL